MLAASQVFTPDRADREHAYGISGQKEKARNPMNLMPEDAQPSQMARKSPHPTLGTGKLKAAAGTTCTSPTQLQIQSLAVPMDWNLGYGGSPNTSPTKGCLSPRSPSGVRTFAQPFFGPPSSEYQLQFQQDPTMHFYRMLVDGALPLPPPIVVPNANGTTGGVYLPLPIPVPFFPSAGAFPAPFPDGGGHFVDNGSSSQPNSPSSRKARDRSNSDSDDSAIAKEMSEVVGAKKGGQWWPMHKRVFMYTISIDNVLPLSEREKVSDPEEISYPYVSSKQLKQTATIKQLYGKKQPSSTRSSPMKPTVATSKKQK